MTGRFGDEVEIDGECLQRKNHWKGNLPQLMQSGIKGVYNLGGWGRTSVTQTSKLLRPAIVSELPNFSYMNPLHKWLVCVNN